MKRARVRRGEKYWGAIATKKWQPTLRKEGDERPARKTTPWSHSAPEQEARQTSDTPLAPPPRTQFEQYNNVHMGEPVTQWTFVPTTGQVSTWRGQATRAGPLSSPSPNSQSSAEQTRTQEGPQTLNFLPPRAKSLRNGQILSSNTLRLLYMIMTVETSNTCPVLAIGRALFHLS